MVEKPTAEKQYYELKAKYPDCILFFRMGDFYELFDNDAIEISRLIGLTLTSRDKGEKKRPMAGIPHHALNQYLGKIVKLGFKVAIAEQMEDPKLAKGIVKRDVVKMITSGTLIDDKNLEAKDTNYIASINKLKNKQEIKYALSWCELSTGEFKFLEIRSRDDSDALPLNIINYLKKLEPKELLITKELKFKLSPIIQSQIKLIEDFQFDSDINEKLLTEHFGISNLKGFGIENNSAGIGASGVILNYLKNIERSDLSHIKNLLRENLDLYMQLDHSTIRNLELVSNINEVRSNKHFEPNLLGILDKTKTPMGKRLIRNWILRPLRDIHMINTRLDIVESLIKEDKNLDELDSIYDLERIIGRIGIETASPKDFIGLKQSIQSILNLISKISSFDSELDIFKDILSFKPVLQEVFNLLNDTFLENPEFEINQGNIFKENYSDEIKELRNIKSDLNIWLENYKQEEILKTGIQNLKVSFNNVFGYYIEISTSQLTKVPGNYIRKQTLMNGERFITQELKSVEDKILNGEQRLIDLEKNLFIEFRKSFKQYISDIQKLSRLISELDTLNSFKIVSTENNYTRPILTNNSEEQIFRVVNGRHPVVEKLVENGFTGNDLDLNTNNFIILTGPNMSGKSTFLRMNAILVIMAQIGCFVPADSFELSLVDKLFSRVGASDNLASGESTFMVEMNETANILNNATKESFVILDEIGRGTSTYDGVAIAWSVVRYIQDQIKCRTLFATHYHELTRLSDSEVGVENLSVQVIENNQDIIFMHKIINGSAEKSFGIHVAKLAGMPEEVVNNATHILKKLESPGEIIKVKSKKDNHIEEPENYPEQLNFL